MQNLILSVEIMNRLYKSSSKVTIIYNGIASKYHTAQYGKWKNVIQFFSDLRAYTFKNIGVNPPITVGLSIKHDDETLVRLAKVRRDLKALNLTLVPEKRGSNFTYCRDTLDMFDGLIKQMIARGAK